MDRTKFDELITENMKSIFGFALTRLGNINDAEELSSDIIYALIKAMPNLKDENRFYGFMWKIAENTYMDYLRSKSRISNRMAELCENIPDERDSAFDKVAKREDLNLLRRELSLLSKQYRDTTVLYYIENLSCSEAAKKLKISTEMVKYYLFRARKIIREGMNMERLYGEKSYRPGIFEIDYWGPVKFNPNEYGEFEKRKIKGNILLTAYYSPMTIQEISIELGVALPYLEDEFKLLLEREYLICNNGKYLTNIPIFTLECTKTIDEKLKALTTSTAERFVKTSDQFNERFSHKFKNENLARWQKILICMHFVLMETEKKLKRAYGETTNNGMGTIWGRSFESSVSNEQTHGIQGIYNGAQATNGRGSVIAMNFIQTINSQRFEYAMTDAVVCSASDCYESLSNDWKERLNNLGYVRDGKANFSVWTYDEYNELRRILDESILLITELSRKTSEIAAEITADLAPAHIRDTAEYVGALVYRFNCIENFVNTLCDMRWVSETEDIDKPALCVVKY